MHVLQKTDMQSNDKEYRETETHCWWKQYNRFGKHIDSLLK